MAVGSEATIGLLPVLLVVFVLLVSCVPDLTERVKAYEATYNAHDIEKLMSFYADDIRFEIVGVWVKSGKHAMRELAEWDRATNMRMTISDISVSGDSVTCELVETNDWWQLAGIGEVLYEPCTMIFRNGVMTEMRAKMASSSVEAYMKAWPAIYEWASQNRSEVLAELLPDGQFTYGEGPARKWLELLREWRASRK
jgi:hypothetical protein